MCLTKCPFLLARQLQRGQENEGPLPLHSNFLWLFRDCLCLQLLKQISQRNEPKKKLLDTNNGIKKILMLIYCHRIREFLVNKTSFSSKSLLFLQAEILQFNNGCLSNYWHCGNIRTQTIGITDKRRSVISHRILSIKKGSQNIEKGEKTYFLLVLLLLLTAVI